MVFDDSGRSRGDVTVKGHTNGREVKALGHQRRHDNVHELGCVRSIPEGKKWIELDLSSAAKGAGFSASAADGPKEGLKILERVEDAKEIGKEDIDGVPTTHYKGTLPTPEEVFGVKVEYSTLHVDVWIDGQGRVRRMQTAVSGSVNEVEGSETNTELTIDYVEFGRVPKIEPPPADEVFNATSEFESNIQSAAEGN